MKNIFTLKTFLFCFLLICLVPGLYAQSVSPVIIGSAGDFFSSGNVQLSWTTGEPMTATFSSGSAILTQGFHQPSSILDNREKHNQDANGISCMIYPNPASASATIVVDGKITQDANIILYDLYGRTHLVRKINASLYEQKIDLSELSSGPYFVRIQTDREIIHTEKLEVIR